MSNITLTSVVLTFALIGCTVAHCQQARYYESFEEGVPDHFAASQPDSLSISPWHYKEGRNSLRWDWSRGEELVIHHGIGDVTRAGGYISRASFSVWVYMQQPLSDALVFEFREGDRVTGWFRFPLSFTGWQQARLFYQDFPNGQPTSEVDNIRIAAPTTVAQGSVFVDFIKYNTLTGPHGSVNPEVVVLRGRPVPDEQRFPRPETVTEAELEGIRKLGGGAQPEAPRGISADEVRELRERVVELGIVRDEHGIRGPGLDGGGYYWTLSGRGGGGIQSSYDERDDSVDIHSPGPISSLAQNIARAYRASDDAQQRAQLAEAFFLVGDHLLDQGQALSAEAVYLMRDVLVEQGRWERYLDSALHAMGIGSFFVKGDAYVRSNMDFYAYHVRRLIRPCLEQPDVAEQVRWLNGWKGMLEQSILQPASSLKIDGSAYHHVGHYHSYAQNAFANFPALIEDLRDTPWRLSPEVHQTFRRAMLAQRLYSSMLDLPVSLTGRSPFEPPYGFIRPHGLEGLDRLARLGTPDGTEEIDREVAAAYLRLVPEAANEEPYRSLGIVPEPDPEGTFTLPYAALLCHRRDDWLATVKGQSKYVWGSERQAQRNAYGIFMGMGNLEILAGGDPVTAEASGRDPLGRGWDWSRFEGTTVPQLPLQKLDDGWRWHPVIYSPESFVGGLSHKGRQGIFAMMVNQPIMPDITLAGRKTWFFDDEYIICLGSDISCTEAEHPTQTTLCQKTLLPDEQGNPPPTVLDGSELTDFPVQHVLDVAQPHWLLDVQQTGYYVPAGQNVTIARQHQTSRDLDDQEDTEGNFLTAWIDHGTTPSNASYEYMLVVRATPEVMQRLTAAPPYRVMQCDRNAHIVRHTPANRWSCVFFVAQTVTEHTVDAETLPVKAVDRPCLVMAEAVNNGQLDISVADPDLNLDAPQDERERARTPHLGAFASGTTLGQGVNQPQLLHVTLRGAWRLVEAKGTLCAWDLPEAPDEVRIVSSDADETVLEILCRHGASYDIRLAR